MPLLIAANLAFALAVAAVGWRWSANRRAIAPLDEGGAVTIRLSGLHEETVDRCLRRALRDLDLVALRSGDARWAAPPAGVVRVAPPVVADRAVVVEVATDRMEDVLAGLVTALLDEGWEVSRTKGRKVTLLRSGLRARLAVAPA